jgi:hypothetical protein
MSYYRGPDFIGNPLDNPARRRAAVFSAATTSRASVPIIETAGDMIVSVHEACHAAFHHFTKRAVFSAEIDGDGGGRFRASALDVSPMLTGREAPVTVAADAKSKREWADLLVGMAAPKFAQRRYSGSTAFDWNCSHDFAVIDRILTGIAGSRTEEHEMLAEIEARARAFVDRHWSGIMRLARALYARSRLDENEIRAVLSRASSVKLNGPGVHYASDLISAGKVNWGPFTWADDTDGEELLDEESEDAVSYYHLGYDTESVGTSKYKFPFGKTEVYVEALKDAEKEGGAVGDYATKLLADIAAQKKQSFQPKRSHGSERLLWRYDGYLKPFR